MLQEQHAEDELRHAAGEMLSKKREFKAHLLAYSTINTFLIVIWALTGAAFFWPMFPLFGWGIGLAFHAWDTFDMGPTEARIEREEAKIRRKTAPRGR